MDIDTLKKLYIHELKDLYNAESQLLEMFSDIREAATDDDLRHLLKGHLEQTRSQVGRLDQLFQEMDFESGGVKCRGMEGLLSELREHIAEPQEKHVRDAGLISALQRVAHYQIAGYGVARTFAENLDDHHASDTLQESLDEEAWFDTRLTRLAERKINPQAATV